jgi:hypothetical protein
VIHHFLMEKWIQTALHDYSVASQDCL